jgi:uncharacterized membrane protein
MTVTVHAARHASTPVEVGRVPVLRPFTWLRRGAGDLFHCGAASLAHGLLMVLTGWMLLLMLGNHPYFVVAAVSGFLLAAPVMTTGLVELSRRRAERDELGFNESLAPLASHRGALLKYGAVLAVLVLGWFAASEALLRALFDLSAPSIAETYYVGFLDAAHRQEVVAYVAAGGVLALVVLAVSVATVPLIVDRDLGAGEAMRASLRAVAANPAPMLVWSALIVSITALGFATLLAGMVVLIPWLGHATWHAYRDLVR